MLMPFPGRISIAVLLLMGASSAWPNTVTFSTAVGATNPSDSQPVDVQVVIQTLANQILVNVKNLESNPKAISQALNEIAFGPLTSTVSAMLNNSSADVIQITSNSSPPTDLGTQSTGWELQSTSTTLDLCLLCVPGMKDNLLLGGPGPGDLYSNANSSIVDNNGHGQFLETMANFTIDLPGVTPDTIITSVQFFFGTTAGVEVEGDYVTPEPATVTTMAVGLILLAVGLAWRRRYIRQTSRISTVPPYTRCG